MRAMIFQHLAENCRTVRKWVQPHKADANTPKPYGVIEMGEETRAIGNRAGRFQGLSIWLYFEEGSYVPVDDAVDEVRSLLHNVVLTGADGRRFALEWEQTTRDYYDPDLKALGRRIDFRIPRGG